MLQGPAPFKPTDDFEDLIPSSDPSGEPDIDVDAPGIVEIWLEVVKLLKTGKVKAVRRVLIVRLSTPTHSLSIGRRVQLYCRALGEAREG